MREWLIYVGIMAAIFVLFFRDNGLVGILGGLLASGPIYLAIGYVLAKLGFQRKHLKELRDEARAGRAESAAEPPDPVDRPRPKPPPTKRTGGGSRQNRPAKRRR